MARGRLRVAAIALAAVGVLAAATPASAETVTYGPNSVLQPFHRWTVPARVCGATFDLYGAEGSGGVGGARVTATLAVKPGTPYDIYVGGWGTRGNGGYNGGGDASGQGSAAGVGGGGATDVRTGPGLADRVLVAGGGGGNGGIINNFNNGVGGAGGQGGLVGQSGTMFSGVSAGGGGGGGIATAGGVAGSSGFATGDYLGRVGRLGFGGDGGTVTAGGSYDGGGGGGGGGLYGGGGGGTGLAGGGGGGGSSLAAGGTVSATSGGNGKAVITYAASPTCGQAGGTGGGTGGGPGGGTGGGADRTKPTLGGLTFSRTSFRAARSGASASARRKPVGTKVSFSLSEASRVNFSVERAVAGRRVNGRCVKPKRSNRGKRSCTRWVTVRGSFGVPGKVGQNAFSFRGRVGGKSLKPGSYRLTGRATDPAGNASSLRRRSFEIIP